MIYRKLNTYIFIYLKNMISTQSSVE